MVALFYEDGDLRGVSGRTASPVRYLGQAELWWVLCDYNDIFFPLEFGGQNGNPGLDSSPDETHVHVLDRWNAQDHSQLGFVNDWDGLRRAAARQPRWRVPAVNALCSGEERLYHGAVEAPNRICRL